MALARPAGGGWRPVCQGVVLYLGDELLPFGERLLTGPVTALQVIDGGSDWYRIPDSNR